VSLAGAVSRFDLSEGGVKRRFEFQKRGQLFIRVRNETLPVVAV
jgi:hypothetical protein